MPKIEITKRLKTLSFSLKTFEYLKYLSNNKKNASEHVDKAIQATKGYQKFKKEKENEKN
jgi:hypothetical protein